MFTVHEHYKSIFPEPEFDKINEEAAQSSMSPTN